MVFLINIPQEIDYPSGNIGSTAVAGGLIAISTWHEGVLLFDSDLNYLRRIPPNGKYPLLVYSIKNDLIVIKPYSKVEGALLIKNGKIYYELDVFRPRAISSDGDTVTLLPGLSHSPDILAFEMKWPPGKNENLIQKIKIRGKKIIPIGNRIMPLTAAQKRSNFNWKGFWIFEDNQKELEIINQLDPAIFRERTADYMPLDIPDFVYKEKPHSMTDKIFRWPEFNHYLRHRTFDTSRIEGVYRYGCGFVLCYVDPGYPVPDFTRLVFFDEDWNRYGQIQIIPGRLIGLHLDQGYILTFPDEAMFSELGKVDLQP